MCCLDNRSRLLTWEGNARMNSVEIKSNAREVDSLLNSRLSFLNVLVRIEGHSVCVHAIVEPQSVVY